jgi:ABC-type taurine transport system ATPase subunit
MRALLPLLALLLLASPAEATNRGTRIAMAVALLDVVQDHCAGRFRVDEEVKKTLFLHFHEYDIAGLASILSRPLNAFYEDFSYEAKRGRDAFCRKAPEEAASTGYPVILAGEP